MRDVRILVLANNEEILQKYKKVLNNNGYYNIEGSTSGSEVLRKSKQLAVDLFIVEESLKDKSGIDIAWDLYECSITNIILLVSRTSHRYATKMFSSGDVVVLPQPINGSILIQALNLYSSKISEYKKLSYEIDTLRKSLDDRKIIDKAKWILIKKFEMTEDSAHKFMQKLSMDRRTSLIKVAEEILIND